MGQLLATTTPKGRNRSKKPQSLRVGSEMRRADEQSGIMQFTSLVAQHLSVAASNKETTRWHTKCTFNSFCRPVHGLMVHASDCAAPIEERCCFCYSGLSLLGKTFGLGPNEPECPDVPKKMKNAQTTQNKRGQNGAICVPQIQSSL